MYIELLSCGCMCSSILLVAVSRIGLLLMVDIDCGPVPSSLPVPTFHCGCMCSSILLVTSHLGTVHV